jgi:CHAT domain-containing protein
VDDENAESSAVLLAAGSDQEDGKLEVREIVDLDLSGQLVVLSACHSASGLLVEGEGVMSLARAFFQAGATTVVASLWQLRDNEAKELFGRFYPHLAEGRSVAASLQAAKKESLEAGAAAEAWAGVVVLGDGSAAPFQRERAGPFGLRWLPWVAGVLVIYSTGLGIRVWRQRRSC